MSGRTSPVNGGFEAANAEPAMRLTVRKDLFPDPRLPKIIPDAVSSEEVDDVSCVKLETDFEQSIDEIAKQKQIVNGAMSLPTKTRHRKHKQHSRRHSERVNGCVSPETKRRKSSSHESSPRSPPAHVNLHRQVKGGKNLNLVSSSECQDEDEDWEEPAEEEESSEDEVLKCSVKLPLINVPRQSGKPYSHKLSQLSTKKSKKNSSKERRTHTVTPCSGKPRSMLGICSSRSKKKSKRTSECTPTYRSQIVDTDTKLKIKIKRTGIKETTHVKPTSVPIPSVTSISDLGQRKSKKKRVASPVLVSSGEEYDPRGDGAASISVGAPKPRNPRPKTPKTKKSNNSKNKSEKTERSRISGAQVEDTGPQSPWAQMPEEILTKIFAYVVSSQGTLPTVIRMGKVCKKWHSVSCRPQLWKNVDLTQHIKEKCKTDFKLVWLLENRLTQCHSLNIAQWEVSNISWVLACIADYCPGLVELSVAGWSRITPEQLFSLLQGLPELQRLDLSLTSETGGSSTCLSAASMARICENFGSRLTHLTLANNKFTALPQILSSVAAYCVNLEVLDISGAQAISHPASVPLEALQKGCPKMRVFRAANSQLVLANATTAQQMETNGWTQLEELSIAGDAATERSCVGEYKLGDEALERMVRGATRLRLLDLRGLQRLTDSGLVRVPAWDLQHLFLGGCNVTRQSSACLELICEKWSHSLLELDLSWASAARVLDDAVAALADCHCSKLRILNLCGSSVSLEPVKKVLLKCPHLESINLSSCRALPRGMKRLYTGKELQDLKDSLDPEKAKTKEENENDKTKKKKKDVKKFEADSKYDIEANISPKENTGDGSSVKLEQKSQETSSSSLFQEPKSVSESPISRQVQSTGSTKSSPDSKSTELSISKDAPDNSQVNKQFTGNTTPKLLSPLGQSRPDSSSTPRSEPGKSDVGSPYFSPVPKPDSQVLNSPEVHPESIKSNSWNLGQFKTTPTHKSEASPLNRLESHTKLKHGKVIEQCSPTTSHENKPSPETLSVKQDIKTPNWSYGSPMPRQDNQFSSQRSPYSAQPSPAQPSPYSTQPSPYSTQPSPYSSQPSPYSAQPSPDTSQMGKADMQKSGAWNPGNYSPMPKQHAPFSPHPSSHASPEPGAGLKSELRAQHSPRPRHERLYSPRPGADGYGNRKSPGCGGYGQPPQTAARAPEPADAALAAAWTLDRFSAASIEQLVWGAPALGSAPPPPAPPLSTPPLSTPPPQPWAGDPWGLGQFRAEPPALDAFVEQSVSFDAHVLQSYLDESFAESSRAD
ncbi:uncharacterized protein Fbl6 isoform X2 [Plodia interpunctella]|uniref:uncharacterized protein Fbl6 isoform X2 n=1 Tax=Plodia interpunctella TaxID=58824 RepID=UPI002367CFCC|nr:uncharacterized protein LOC128669993 isoform X2 [Plodia interpunctella]